MGNSRARGLGELGGLSAARPKLAQPSHGVALCGWWLDSLDCPPCRASPSGQRLLPWPTLWCLRRAKR
eukprot:7954574-Alexandrium_andersonii.AAC.1